jgi:redox-sensitive bicupin YhaK (pirin superfamily)
MWVGPHPHIGLQTVTWLLEGEVLHRDSVGSVQLIKPGQLNVMTSGKGISHSEETPKENSGHMHGLQFWVALPDESRNVDPHFEHIADVPSAEVDGVTFNVFAGTAFGVTCDAKYYSPIVGFDAHLRGAGSPTIPVEPDFEHAVLVTSGAVTIDGETVEPGWLGYLGTGRDSVTLEHDGDAHVAILGGEPFGEEIYMWWNFVARSADEIREARNDWAEGRRFPEVEGFEGKRLEVPEFLGAG